MGLETAAAVAAIVGAGATAYSAVSSQQAAKEQKRSNAAALDNANKQAAMAEQDMNKRNAKTPDIAAMLAANSDAAKAGVSSTMLTGTQGVDPKSLTLGKNTLLGV